MFGISVNPIPTGEGGGADSDHPLLLPPPFFHIPASLEDDNSISRMIGKNNGLEERRRENNTQFKKCMHLLFELCCGGVLSS